MSESFDEIRDVVVVGSGAGGMSAAITAAKAGLDVLLIEKSDYIGGSTAVSGGAARRGDGVPAQAWAKTISQVAGIRPSIRCAS